MSQAHIEAVRMESQELPIDIEAEDISKRKVTIKLSNYHHVSVFQNGEKETVVNVRKGTRSVSLSKETLAEICDLKETILLCCSFVECKGNK